MDEQMIEKRVDWGTKGSINRKCARRYQYVLLDLSTPTCLCLFLPTWICLCKLYTSWISALLSHQDWYWQRYTFANCSTSKHLQHGFVWNVGAKGGLQEGEIDKFQNHNEQIAAVLRTQLLKSLWDPNLVPEVSIRGCRRSWSSLSYCCAANGSVPCCFYELTTDSRLSVHGWLSSGRNISVAMSSTQRPRSLRVYMIGGGQGSSTWHACKYSLLLTLKILTPAHPPAHSF